MGQITISLPDDIADYVEAQVGGDFADLSEYVTELVRGDREERLAELRHIVDEAQVSGISTRTVSQIFDDAVGRVRARGTLRD